MLLLNNISRSTFDSSAAEFSNTERERANIVTAGRLLMRERAGRDAMAMATLTGDKVAFNSMLNEGGKELSYEDANRNYQKNLLTFCAERACKVTGRVAPKTMEDFRRMQNELFTDGNFLATLSGITSEVVQPMLPTATAGNVDWLCDVVTTPAGTTKEIDLVSNDIFVFDDDSHGASRSKPAQTLYTKTVTLNPRPRTARATMKWYQVVGNDADIGAYFNAIAAGMYSKIGAVANGVFASMLNNTAMVPQDYRFTNTTQNWAKLARKLGMANGVPFRGLVAVGLPEDLMKALPSGVTNGAATNLDAALTYGLGNEWVRNGFLGEYAGVRLFAATDSIVPGTQNTGAVGTFPEGNIIMMPLVGRRLLTCCYEEGGAITVTLEPSKTADGSMDIIATVSFEIKATPAKKSGIITA